MPSISLYQKLLQELGEKGLMQAAKAEGLAVKNAAEIPDTVLQRVLAKSKGGMERPASAEKLPTKAELDAIERATGGSDVAPEFRETAADYATYKPSSSKLPAPTPGPQPEAVPGFEPVQMQGKPPAAPAPGTAPLDNATSDFMAPQVDAETKGMSKMLKGMGAVGAAAAVGTAVSRGASGSWGDEPQAGQPGAPAGPVSDQDLNYGKVPGSLKERVQASQGSGSGEPGISIPKVGQRPADYSADKFNYDDSSYQKKLKELQDSEEGAKGKYEKNKNINEWGEVAERIAQAATSYGAAKSGLKSGVDLSQLKFGKADWANKTDNEAKDLEREQRSLGNQRETARDSFTQQSRAAETQFGREEAAKNKTQDQKFKEYEAQVAAHNRAKEKANELALQKSRDEQSRAQGLEDFEKKQQIEAKYRPAKDSKEDKAETKKQEALSGLAAAYLSGDKKEISKQRLAATKYMTPQQSAELQDAEDSWFGSDKKASSVIEKILTGSSLPAGQAQTGQPSGGMVSSTSGASVVFEVNGKKGAVPADQADAFQKKYPSARRLSN